MRDSEEKPPSSTARTYGTPRFEHWQLDPVCGSLSRLHRLKLRRLCKAIAGWELCLVHE